MPMTQNTKVIINPELYFDWAATAIPDQDILQAALQESLENWGNPSSAHAAGKSARTALEAARKTCADGLGVKAENIFFTSGGTESNHIPLLSILNRPERGTVLFSSIEHPAVREMAQELKHCGMNVKQIPCGKDGIITAEMLRQSLSDDTLFVGVMAVNNETGAIQPIYELADTITDFYKNRRRPKFHVDCVQALGKIPLDIAHKGINSAAFSAHKICGPRGIGILYLADKIEPFLKGGGQESNIRSGTENLFGTIAFAKCIERYAILKNAANDNSNTPSPAVAHFEEQKKLTAEFLNKLNTIKSCTIIPAARMETPQNYSPWVVQAAFKNIPGNVMLRALDAKGIAISTGSACSTKKASRPVLEAMSISADLRESAVRFSFGTKTTEQGMNALFEAVCEVCETFRQL